MNKEEWAAHRIYLQRSYVGAVESYKAAKDAARQCCDNGGLATYYVPRGSAVLEWFKGWQAEEDAQGVAIREADLNRKTGLISQYGLAVLGELAVRSEKGVPLLYGSDTVEERVIRFALTCGENEDQLMADADENALQRSEAGKEEAA
jgi:hypothetical protein